MKQEEIILLLTDTCGRLKSNLICEVIHKDYEGWKEEDMVLSGIIDDEGYFTTENGSTYSSEFKPYLRSMTNMSEEEKDEYDRLVMCNASWVVDDWLITNHFDFRGLIPMGLALEAKEGMYD